MNNLNLEDDNFLVESIKNNSNAEKCLEVLINRHSGLCINMINGYMSKNHNDSLRQELIKEKDFQIYNSALKYNPQKGSKFSTYLGNEIKWKCLNLYNRDKRRKTVPVEEELINYFSYQNSENSIDNELFDNIINQAENHSDERIGKIFHLRYVEGSKNSVMPWKSISSIMNMSIQGCINLHNSALKQFRNKIRKEISDE
jgi:RNA polymerase sigma factor (sigma-70 family)